MSTPTGITEYQTGYLVTFQANTNALWVYTPWGGAWTNNLAMAPGTDPAVMALPNGTFQVAYQGSNKDLYNYTPESGAKDLSLGMAIGTNPGISR